VPEALSLSLIACSPHDRSLIGEGGTHCIRVRSGRTEVFWWGDCSRSGERKRGPAEVIPNEKTISCVNAY
jgi:hypothetical protein